jgi:thymidylate synthase (FAD)
MVELRWITPDADASIGYMARVSNPKATPDDPADKLIAYLIQHKHWSPFEMANMCVEITTTRDIGRQILRHWSFHFQEFSQRYAVVDEEPLYSGVRLQDTKNRQNSIVTDDPELEEFWNVEQEYIWSRAYSSYKDALKNGVAKELARKLLPEGLTRTRMYMNGTIRDWLHYLSIRTGPETQYEHRLIAKEVESVFKLSCPVVYQAAQQAGLIGFVK